MQGVLIVSIGWEGAQSGRWSGRTARGRGQGGRGKGKGAIVSQTCGHLGDPGENGESYCSAKWPPIANG